MTIPIFNEKQIVEKILAQKNPFYNEYYAYYSSWFGGIVKNPQWMLLPLDDHMVHRGDGVFETMKAVGRGVYLLDEHLDRLFKSADELSLKSPIDVKQMKNIILETLRVADQSDVLIRLYLSRGPGNFSANPYDSVEPQLYLAITQLNPPTASKYENGVHIGQTNIPVKASWLAQIKTCNYLPNVLMKKESVDRQLDFVIGIDPQGYITESATENIMIVDNSGTIVHPSLKYILKGTTMIRACELARDNHFNTEVRPISIDDLRTAKEVMITGTSLNVLPVVKFENDEIADAKPGPVAKKLNELMLKDIAKGTHSTFF